MKTLFILLSLYFTSNCFSQTTFPLEVGNKWYYEARSNQREFYYGIVREITNIQPDSSREMKLTYYYKDSVTYGKETWKYTDGKLYINNRVHYIDSLTKDSTWTDGLYGWKLIPYEIFNIHDTAQVYTTGWIFHTGNYHDVTTVFPNVGLVKTYYYAYYSGDYPHREDSTILIGMYRNCEVFGDTVIKAPVDTATAYFPLDLGDKWIYSLKYSHLDIVEHVVKEVIKILDNGFREIQATYHYTDGPVIKKEYWLYKDRKFYISREPDIESALLCYDVTIKTRECVLKSDGEYCLQPATDKYSFMGNEYDYQVSDFDGRTSDNIQLMRFSTINNIGPVTKRYKKHGQYFFVTEELIFQGKDWWTKDWWTIQTSGTEDDLYNVFFCK